MTIGTQLSPSGINGKATALAMRWQQLATDTLAFANAIAALGSSGLQGLTPAGFGVSDANAMVAIALQFATVAGVYYGTAAQPTPVNYDAVFLQLRGTG